MVARDPLRDVEGRGAGADHQHLARPDQCRDGGGDRFALADHQAAALRDGGLAHEGADRAAIGAADEAAQVELLQVSADRLGGDAKRLRQFVIAATSARHASASRMRWWRAGLA